MMRNPQRSDGIGKPPASAAQTPGVVIRKLRVARNRPTAITLPTTDMRGAQGLTANRAAALSSTTPSTVENARTEKMS